MNKVEKEYASICEQKRWIAIYESILQQCEKYAFTVAKKSNIQHLNRYQDVSPYDHTRVMLNRVQNDYINANYVNVHTAHKKYILTQGPLEVTISHFWTMVWEQNSKGIIMLNKVYENHEEKCYHYWPIGIGEDYKINFKDVMLDVELISVEDYKFYKVRIIRIRDRVSGNSRDITHLQYLSWPDFGVPNSPHDFLIFLNRAREFGILHSSCGPPVIHCSAGIGRSGTFVLVDACLTIIALYGVDELDIRETLIKIRNYRMGLIQTPDQLKFCYEAIIEGAKFFSAQAPEVSEEQTNNQSRINGGAEGAEGTAEGAEGTSEGAEGTLDGAEGTSEGAEGTAEGAEGSTEGAEGSVSTDADEEVASEDDPIMETPPRPPPRLESGTLRLRERAVISRCKMFGIPTDGSNMSDSPNLSEASVCESLLGYNESSNTFNDTLTPSSTRLHNPRDSLEHSNLCRRIMEIYEDIEIRLSNLEVKVQHEELKNKRDSYVRYIGVSMSILAASIFLYTFVRR